MKKLVLAAACAMLMCGSAFAQSSQGNAGPGTMNNESMTKGQMSKDGMKDGMKDSKSGMNNNMSGGSMSKDGMKDGMKK